MILTECLLQLFCLQYNLLSEDFGSQRYRDPKSAPYSYDWLDNSGYQRPHQFTPEPETVELGQRVMSIY